MVDELGLVERIDQLLPKDEERRTLSHGQVVKAMIINGLGFNQRALYLSSRFFQDKPVARLIGDGIEAAHINDDVQGRTLDTIYGYGLERFYAQLSVQAAVRLGLTCRTGHLDSTSFHVDGGFITVSCPPMKRAASSLSRKAIAVIIARTSIRWCCS